MGLFGELLRRRLGFKGFVWATSIEQLGPYQPREIPRTGLGCGSFGQ